MDLEIYLPKGQDEVMFAASVKVGDKLMGKILDAGVFLKANTQLCNAVINDTDNSFSHSEVSVLELYRCADYSQLVSGLQAVPVADESDKSVIAKLTKLFQLPGPIYFDMG